MRISAEGWDDGNDTTNVQSFWREIRLSGQLGSLVNECGCTICEPLLEEYWLQG